MRLVIQDMDLDVDSRLDRKQAVFVLRTSASYGVAMFPDDEGEWTGASGEKRNEGDDELMGVADRMVMERALKRRKELEEAEEDEIQLVIDGEERPRKRREKDVEILERDGDKQEAESSKPFVASSSEYFVALTKDQGQMRWLDRQEEAQRAEETAARGGKRPGKERDTGPPMDQNIVARPRPRPKPPLKRNS